MLSNLDGDCNVSIEELNQTNDFVRQQLNDLLPKEDLNGDIFCHENVCQVDDFHDEDSVLPVASQTPSRGLNRVPIQHEIR